MTTQRPTSPTSARPTAPPSGRVGVSTTEPALAPGETPLFGLELRYFLTLHLHAAGRPCTVRDLVAALDARRVVVAGRPSKVVSDALRWEIRRGRAVRDGRGRYRAGSMPRQTRAWMRDRLATRFGDLAA